tara:strand:- start:322 stop:729 length:408 start_codon:yes stop_codon:yes gene_type:complete
MRRLQNLLPLLLIVSFLFTASMAIAKDYIIYSIGHDLPMGQVDQKIRKNFYVNMGANQGLESGSVLTIYRQLSQLDPYATKKRYNYKIKIGELKVIHAEEDAAIGTLHSFNNSEEAPLIDVEAPMIGDQISVKVD